ncbi:MAG: hypothetical protein HYZ72_07655 [Deltaproteobacteria bacterium]|nr:hypothetical protein [Deltaproteobacteria bacterium]
MPLRCGLDPAGAWLSRPARARIREALALAQELSHPFILTGALGAAAIFHQLRREGQAAQERAAAAITLSTEQGFTYWLALETILRGWTLAERGQGEEGIAQIRQGLDASRTMGVGLWRSHVLGLLAEAYGKVGQAEEGLSALDEALAAVHETGQRWYEAEVYRLKGELSLQSRQVADKSKTSQDRSKASPRQVKASLEHVETSQDKSEVRSPEAEAEECFWKAIEVARRQSARSFELRAVMSLARLWQQQGKKEEAQQMLAEIYGWFTEGFNTADLKDAKALLEELS